MRLFPRWLMLVLMLAAALWVGGLVWFARAIPDASTPKGKYDAIIALTGGQLRISSAISMLADEKAPLLFISGVGDGFSAADLELATPSELKGTIEYGEQARSTLGNAEETLAWLEGKPYRHLLIVTANYHMPRTKLLFTHYLPEYDLGYAPVDPPGFRLDGWLWHPNSRRLVLLEYHKWLATWLQLSLWQ